VRANSRKIIAPTLTGPFEKPSVLVRFEIEKVLARFRSGIHRSMVAGAGAEFKSFRPYDASDSLRSLDAAASARFSEHPDVEPMSRTYYTEKEIATIVLLDRGESMKIPPRKEEHAAQLLWLFALSTFRYGDRFRLISFDANAIFDSLWIGDGDTLEQFLRKMHGSAPLSSMVPWAQDVFSYLAHLSLRDGVVVIISDFCGQWEKRINTLKSIGLHENNIQPVMIALDEWYGFTSHTYGVALHDPVIRQTATLDMRKKGNMAQYAHQAHQRFLDITERIRPLGIPMIITPLITDPLATIFKAFLKMDWI